MLTDNFVSSWYLVADLKFLMSDETQPELASVAKHQMDGYRFPVMLMVTLPNGTIVHSVNANEFMESEREEESSFLENIGITDSSNTAYISFLTTGLKKAKVAMMQSTDASQVSSDEAPTKS